MVMILKEPSYKGQPLHRCQIVLTEHIVKVIIVIGIHNTLQQLSSVVIYGLIVVDTMQRLLKK